MSSLVSVSSLPGQGGGHDAGVGAETSIVPRGTSMMWTLFRRLLLRFARVDMLVSGAGLVIDGAVSASWYTSGSSGVGLMIGGAVSVF